ncbi:MAG: hypothetical protein L0211_05065 [Planctomycetaceae bacterium]|nr:hypothetical protein [Planctomycetaceae bacterium]
MFQRLLDPEGVGWHSDHSQWGSLPAAAPIVHLNGPLTMTFKHWPSSLIRGKDCPFFAAIGTPGLGPRTFAQVRIGHNLTELWYTRNAVAEFEFTDDKNNITRITEKLWWQP